MLQCVANPKFISFPSLIFPKKYQCVISPNYALPPTSSFYNFIMNFLFTNLITSRLLILHFLFANSITRKLLISHFQLHMNYTFFYVCAFFLHLHNSLFLLWIDEVELEWNHHNKNNSTIKICNWKVILAMVYPKNIILQHMNIN